MSILASSSRIRRETTNDVETCVSKVDVEDMSDDDSLFGSLKGVEKHLRRERGKLSQQLVRTKEETEFDVQV